MSDQRAEITPVQPDDPALAVKLKARPPVVGTTYNDKPKHGEWTLDLMERTLLEFRVAGAWDGAIVEINGGGYEQGGNLTCEVLATHGDMAMPWGWRPSQGPPPPPERPAPLPDPVVPDGRDWPLAGILGNRVLHGVLLLVLVVLTVVFR